MFGLASKHRASRSDKVISLDDGLMDQFLVAKRMVAKLRGASR